MISPKRLLCMCAVLLSLNLFPAFATDQSGYPTVWSQSLGSSVWCSATSHVWGYSGNEPVWNSRCYKTASISGPWSNGPAYVVIESSQQGSGDPKVWYLNNGTWSYLSDDEGEGNNFRTVIHFNGNCSSVLTEFLFSHFGTGDNNDYHFSQEVRHNDPSETGCYYLEVYPDGTKTLVAH